MRPCTQLYRTLVPETCLHNSDQVLVAGVGNVCIIMSTDNIRAHTVKVSRDGITESHVGPTDLYNDYMYNY